MKEEITKITESDGPTAVYIASDKRKNSLKHKIYNYINQIHKAHIRKHIKANEHNLDQVSEYIVDVLGYKEIGRDDTIYKQDYKEIRSSFIMQYKPELLGEYAEIPILKDHTEEALKEHWEQFKQREKAAEEVPAEKFDIDLHTFVKENGNNESRFVIEKHYDYIGGGASGNKHSVRKFNRDFRRVYRYYGVSQYDIDNKSERFEEVVRTLAIHN